MRYVLDSKKKKNKTKKTQMKSGLFDSIVEEVRADLNQPNFTITRNLVYKRLKQNLPIMSPEEVRGKSPSLSEIEPDIIVDALLMLAKIKHSISPHV